MEKMEKIKLDGRLGFSLEVTPQEFAVLTGEDRVAAKEMLAELVQSEQCTIVGDTYFPVEWNEDVLSYDMENDLSFDLPPISFGSVSEKTTTLEEEIEETVDYKAAVDKAVLDLYFVGEGNVIELYADRGDTGEFLLEAVYESRTSAELDNMLHDKIFEAYFDVIDQYEHDVLVKAGVVGEEYEDEALEYLRETYTFEPPYDHFASHEMKVNIMLATDEEQNRECVGIHEQFIAMVDPDEVWDAENTLKENTGLSWLLEQQGHSMNELRATMKDYREFFYDEDGCVRWFEDESGNRIGFDDNLASFNQNHSNFLTSICVELENQGYFMGCMTVLAKMSISDFIEMQRGEKQITMPKDSMIGIFNPWNGSGSCLEIELEKDLVFNSDLIRDVQIEGVKPQFEYTVDDVFGLVGTCWKEPKGIEDSKKPGLDSVIKDASEQAGQSHSNKKNDIDLDL